MASPPTRTPPAATLAAENAELRAKCARLERQATELRRAAAALGDCELSFQSLFDEIGDPIFTLLPDGRYGYANLAFAEGVGKRQDEICGKSVRDVFGKSEADKRLAVVRWVLKHRAARTIEVRVPRPDGDRHFVTTAKPIAAKDGTITCVLCISREITERKRIERELAESEERLEFALANSGLWPWDMDVRKRTMTANRGWCEMLGYDPDAVSIDLEALWQLIHPDDLQKMQQTLVAHLKGDTPSFGLEYRLRHQDGHWVWLLARGKITSRDPQGRALRLVGTNQDISVQRRLDVEGGEVLKRIEALLRAASERPAGTATTSPVPATLSERQRQVLELVATGCTSAEIARRLGIESATAMTHRRDLMRRLDLHSVAELTRYAIEHGLVRR